MFVSSFIAAGIAAATLLTPTVMRPGYSIRLVSGSVPAAVVTQMTFKPGDLTHLYASQESGTVLRYDYDLDFLAGIRRCRVAGARAGVVLETQFFSLQNPAGSGVIATISQLVVDSDVGVDVSVLVAASSMAGTPTSLIAAAVDSRWQLYSNAVNQTACLASVGTAGLVPAASIEILRYSSTAARSGPRGSNLDIVLHPGRFFHVYNRTQNVAMIASLAWTERKALPAELP